MDVNEAINTNRIPLRGSVQDFEQAVELRALGKGLQRKKDDEYKSESPRHAAMIEILHFENASRS